jgi:hypothetical protein
VYECFVALLVEDKRVWIEGHWMQLSNSSAAMLTNPVLMTAMQGDSQLKLEDGVPEDGVLKMASSRIGTL